MKRKFWTIALGSLVALLVAGSQWFGATIAQTPPSPAPAESPAPAATPAPEAAPPETPEAMPETPDATAEPVPSPTVAPPEFSEPEAPGDLAPQDATVPDVGGDLTVGEGNYSEAGRFEVGILEGYEAGSLAGIPLIESPDGNLAYTVLRSQHLTGELLSTEALTNLALEELEDGEAFQLESVEASVPGAVLVTWSGKINSGTPSETVVEGKALVRQVDRTVLMLVVSATDDGIPRVSSAISTLAPTLKALSPEAAEAPAQP